MFAGIDRSTYPGDPAMQWLWDNTNLYWTGYYLAPAPSHGNTSWMGRRGVLSSMGWGFAPIYVGQQEKGPGTRLLSAAQGDTDGTDAASLASQEGFPGLSVLYLDIEGPPPFHQPMIEYYQAWAQAVFDNGFYPGVY